MNIGDTFGRKTVYYRIDDIQPYKQTYFLKFSSVEEKENGKTELYDCGWRFQFNGYSGIRDTKEGCEVAFDCYNGHKDKYFGKEWIDDFIRSL